MDWAVNKGFESGDTGRYFWVGPGSLELPLRLRCHAFLMEQTKQPHLHPKKQILIPTRGRASGVCGTYERSEV